jgi:hypothetical protein
VRTSMAKYENVVWCHSIYVIIVFVQWPSPNTRAITYRCSIKKNNRITPACLMAWGHVTVDILTLSLIGKAKTILLHFSLKLEDLETKGVWMEGKPTWVLHGMLWLFLHGLLDFVWSLRQRGRSNTRPWKHRLKIQ